ncbi:hypothetical protein BJX66DRAFT_303661 [Aspergillus keveii]|uniref:Uncharacterized protein n=1 Tax=Aspergillus keveii TaxID=714993 RepID=A0ABR4G670_9EURO
MDLLEGSFGGLGQEQVPEVPRKRADLLPFRLCDIRGIQNYIRLSCPNGQCLIVKQKQAGSRGKGICKSMLVTGLTALVTQLILSQGWRLESPFSNEDKIRERFHRAGKYPHSTYLLSFCLNQWRAHGSSGQGRSVETVVTPHTRDSSRSLRERAWPSFPRRLVKM